LLQHILLFFVDSSCFTKSRPGKLWPTVLRARNDNNGSSQSLTCLETEVEEMWLWLDRRIYRWRWGSKV